MRLFIAINFNDEIKSILRNTISSLRKYSSSGNFTSVDNLHMTLAFIGETNDAETAKKCIDAVANEKFELTLCKFGNYGSLYWAGIKENPFLSELACELQYELRSNGYEIENRKFSPHITLARELYPTQQIRLYIPETAMTVEKISLMKSERINGKLTYTEIYGKTLY